MNTQTKRPNLLLEISFYSKFGKLIVKKIKSHFISLLMECKIEYQTRKFRREIITTSHLQSFPQSHVEIISVTSHQDLPAYILAIRSLLHFTNRQFAITLVDDGTLTEIDCNEILHIVKGIKLIRSPKLFQLIVDIFGEKNIYVQNFNNPYVRKKIASILCTTHDKILFLDSDILFFKKPTQILNWMDNKQDAIYIQDFQNAYIFSAVESKNIFNIYPLPKVNSGLIGISKSMLNQKLLTKVLTHAMPLTKFRPPHLQVYFALIFAENVNVKITPLPHSYVVSDHILQYQNKNNICKHYVYPVRQFYLNDAYNLVKHLNSR